MPRMTLAYLDSSSGSPIAALIVGLPMLALLGVAVWFVTRSHRKP
jgi:hypothetical protein